MKFMKKLALVLITCLTLIGAAACSKKSGSSEQSEKITPKVTKKTTVVFWHGMTGVQQTTLQELTKKFEKQNPKITVKLENQGTYNDLQAKINSTLQSPKNLPTITQAYPGWLWDAAKNKMLVDLKSYITNKEVGWGSIKNSDIRPELLSGATISGRQYGIPFNKSIETLTYNADLFKKYGIKKAPRTMQELKTDSKRIYEKSNHKVVGAGFDSLANYYALGMKNQNHNFNDQVDFTGTDSKKIINYYADGVKAGYFRTAGSEHYLSGPFANEKVAMYVGTSAGEGFVKQSVGQKFVYEVAPRPGKYTMQQGTDIYMFKQATSLQKTAAFKYIKFLVSKDSQLKWANKTGYIPVNEDVVKSTSYKKNKDIKLPKKLESAMRNLYSIPVTKNSNSAYQQLNPIMQSILQKNSDVKKATETGKVKLEAAWKQ